MSEVKEKKEKKNLPVQGKTKESVIKDTKEKRQEKKEQEEENLIQKPVEEPEIKEKIEEIEPVGTILKENKIEENAIEIEDGQSKKKDWLRQYSVVIAIIAILLSIGLVVFSTAFGLSNRSSNKIVSGISIKGIDVSGLTMEDAKEKISKLFYDTTKQNIILKQGEYETSILPEQIAAGFGIEEATNMAYSIGRSGKLLKDNYAIVNARLNKIEINPSFSYQEKVLEDFISTLSNNLPDKVEQSSYSIEDNNLVISKGKAGTIVKNAELKELIIKHITELKTEEQKILIPVETKEPDKLDIEKIHTEIYKQPQDAYYIKEPFSVHPQVNGMDFNISIEEAKKLMNQETAEVTIPLKITIPKITTNQIGTEAFPNLLATYSTSFSTSNSNRTTNIRLASNKINRVVLMPGEEFSYNKVVGKRTVQAGYKEAAAYLDGKVVNDIGGGICQVSSTLYNTVLRANLEIIKRSNHRFSTGYVPLSTDATVSWGGPEFVFKNSRKYPVKIVSSVNGGKIKIDVYGCREEVEYEVQIKSETLQTIPTKVVYKTNTTLPKGTQKTLQKGHGGYKSRAYRILSLNGKVISKQLLSTDTYSQLETIIEKN